MFGIRIKGVCDIMKKYVQEAIDINIWTSIQDNIFDRNKDIKSFIEGLELINGGVCISLDAKWGDGKTFFVRQIEEVLKYIRLKQWGDEENSVRKLSSYEYLKDNRMVNSIDLQTSYLPIYYNAWMYDNHSDPLMSLILVMIKVCKGTYNTKINSEKISEKLLGVLSALPISLKGVNPADICERLVCKSTDILLLVKTEEEIRERVKEIFNDIIVERTQKLIIFIDELDRCRPSFAIEMLERIKHYFDDERVMFVISVNKEQLVHTIANYYGAGFDATRYLNKFFDLNINLPEMSNYQKRIVECSNNNSKEKFWFAKIADELGMYHHLSLRDKLIYKSRIEAIPEQMVNCLRGESFFIALFVACMLLLDIVDVNEKKKFLEGKSDFVEKVLPQIEIYKRFISRVIGDGSRNEQEEKFKEGCEEVIKIYRYVFESETEGYYERFDIDRNTKQKCIAAYNGHIYY